MPEPENNSPEYVQGFDKRLSHLEGEVSDVKTSLAHVNASVTTGFDSLAKQIAHMDAQASNRINRLEAAADERRNPYAWVGIGALIVTIVAAASAFQNASMDNIRVELGYIGAAVGENRNGLNKRAEVVFSAPYRIEALEEQLAEIRRYQLALIEKASDHDAELKATRHDLTTLEESDVRTRNDADDLRSTVSRMAGGLEVTSAIVQRLENFSRESAYIHGQREALEKRVNDIDNIGSRATTRRFSDVEQRLEE